MKNILFKTLAVGLICVQVFQCAAFADETVESSAENVYVSGEVFSPYSSYQLNTTITATNSSTTSTIKIYSRAAKTADYIYHDVVIYKNHQLYSSGTYSAYDTNVLNTTLSVAATSGDYIDIYVSSHLVNGSDTETYDTSKAFYF